MVVGSLNRMTSIDIGFHAGDEVAQVKAHYLTNFKENTFRRKVSYKNI